MFGAPRVVRLREAVVAQDRDAVAKLVRRRIVNQRDHMGRTALYLAASREDAEIVKLLLDAGADPNTVTSFGQTPFYTALSSPFTGPGIIELLREHGADPRRVVDVAKRDRAGRTPLHDAVTSHGIGKLELVHVLLDNDADAGARDRDGWTPLHFAAARDSVDVVRLLLDAGADVDAENDNGDTPLIEATKSSPCALEMIALLRDHGADPFHENAKGSSAVRMAKRPTIGGNSESRRAAQTDLFDDPRADWQPQAYVPDPAPQTLLERLIAAIELLRDEGMRNGNVNWGDRRLRRHRTVHPPTPRRRRGVRSEAPGAGARRSRADRRPGLDPQHRAVRNRLGRSGL